MLQRIVVTGGTGLLGIAPHLTKKDILFIAKEIKKCRLSQ